MSKIDDLTRLKHIRDASERIIQFTEGRSRSDLDTDEMLALALVRLVEIIGEAANHISPDCQGNYSNIPWRQMIGMRNRLVHAYFDVDLDILWVVVSRNIPTVLGQITTVLAMLENQ
ncbi:DUF86 domain-containing protein [[Limnothrix rosea] IAM M-220]|uniref:HepT-like ribonuclease domain-containing protein n=1 Tax=[Limnothrix rosea] IAM M-220 TaxID=454133 RepID=UPI00095E3F6D|nr:DUF86 domain-containing protein [[Limnothrix rosea] IAM M-220]OKH19058.1 hypothetical protein NIES208_03565 [[Limnothrix rosea] IAM M-220]